VAAAAAGARAHGGAEQAAESEGAAALAQGELVAAPPVPELRKRLQRLTLGNAAVKHEIPAYGRWRAFCCSANCHACIFAAAVLPAVSVKQSIYDILPVCGVEDPAWILFVVDCTWCIRV
jgi:hypothetical protein